MINPSDINFSTLPWLPLDAKSAFPKNPAIYFAIDSQDKIQYVGRSINPRGRWANHDRYEQLNAIGGVKIVYLFVDSPALLPEIESALILWFDPPMNTVGRSANISNELADSQKKAFTFRVTQGEWESLEEYCNESGRSKNDILREFIRGLKWNAAKS